jgi:hypothetical protein
MKKFIFSALSLITAFFMIVSCDDTFDDLVTANVKTGGIINPTPSVPYKLGSTPSFNVTLDIPKGPGIDAIEIYRTYTDKTKVLDQTIDVGSENANGEVSKTVNYTYAKLIAGLSLPADENLLEIGDKWTLSYVSLMDDGRAVDVSSSTVIAVANFFAGSYEKHYIYHHPSYGTYPDDIYGDEVYNVDLVAKNAYECDDWFGSWQDNIVTIHIDQAANYAITVTTDRSDAGIGNPYDPSVVPTYDQATGVIHIYYFYSGAGGYRFFDITYTPR